jgi:hypothetical protein
MIPLVLLVELEVELTDTLAELKLVNPEKTIMNEIATMQAKSQPLIRVADRRQFLVIKPSEVQIRGYEFQIHMKGVFTKF